MKTTQIATVLLVGLAVVGLAFVGPAAAHGGASTPTTDSTWNDSRTANDTHWNGSASDAGTAQWPAWMGEQFGQDHLAWMDAHMSDRQTGWTDTGSGDEWDVRSPGTVMHGIGPWSADQPAQQPGQQFGSGYGGSMGGYGGSMGGYGSPMGGWGGHGC